jgi:5-formyltetrahydrofolate cyclo-ligase
MASPAPSNAGSAFDSTRAERQALRRRLLVDRERFAAGPEAAAASAALTAHLARLLRDVEPERLGLYWPVRGEFNAIGVLEAAGLPKLPLALPFAQRHPPAMHYRAWNGLMPAGVDQCGLPAPSTGPAVVPDVVLVPCVGYTRSGLRLGYGGGYFDRWLAEHAQVTAIGIAWSIGEIPDSAFAAQAHDRPLMIVLTERGVVA